MPDGVNKPASLSQCGEAVDLDRGMADHAQQLLVRPHIALERRDIEIADRDHRPRSTALGREPRRQFVEKLQFVGKFRVGVRIGNVASRRHIDVVQFGAAGQLDHGMAAVGSRAPRPRRRRGERQARQDGDAVIALHAVHQQVAIAQRLELRARKQLVRGLGLLEAQNIGLLLLEEAADEPDAQPDRVDVPGDQPHGSHPPELFNTPGIRREPDRANRATTKRRPVGGMTGRLLARSVGQVSGPQGRRAGHQRALRPLCFWNPEMGSRGPSDNAIHACDIGKKRIRGPGTLSTSPKRRGGLPRFPR